MMELKGTYDIKIWKQKSRTGEYAWAVREAGFMGDSHRPNPSFADGTARTRTGAKLQAEQEAELHEAKGRAKWKPLI